MLTPDFNWFVASGWWNANYIMITANTAKSPCTVQELQRASYSLIASDRGPMLNTQAVHSLSGKRLSELYNEYTAGCESFANGKGVCNYQWAGYFYDGVWLIANALHGFLIDQNRRARPLDGTLLSGRWRSWPQQAPARHSSSFSDHERLKDTMR